MKRPDVSIIIPAFQEEQVIGKTLNELAKFLDSHNLGVVEVVVVAADGGDSTARIAMRKAKKFEHFKLVEPGRKVGKGRDVRAGMLAATGEKRIFTDADLATPLHHLPAMIKALDEHDVVIGVRQIAKIHKGFRSFMSQVGNVVIRKMLLPGFHDTQCGFKGFTAQATEQLFDRLHTLGWGFDMEILMQARAKNLTIGELQISDWHEARESNFRHDSSLGVAYKSFVELLTIRLLLWQNWLKWFIPASAVIAAGFLFTYRLGDWSIWFDEAFTAKIIQFSPAEIAALTAQDVHPPFYYILLKGWAEIFGHSEVGLRSLSVVCAIGAMIVGFLLVKRLFGRKAAYVALPVLLLAPFLLRYGQEARMYALASLIGVSATYVFVRATEATSNAKRWWASYAVLIALGMYTHYFTALIWIVHWIWRWYMVRRQKTTPHARMHEFFSSVWIRVHLAALVIFAPWLPWMIFQFVTIQSNGFWIGPVSHETLLNIASGILAYHPTWEIKNWFAVAFVATLILLGITIKRTYLHLTERRQENYVLLLLYAFAPIVLLFIASLPPLRPALTERYFAHTVMGLYLLIGVSFALAPSARKWFTSKTLTILLTLVLMVMGVTHIQNIGNFNYNEMRQPYSKETMAYIKERTTANEAIIANSPYLFYELDYYKLPNQTFFFDPNFELGRIGSTAMLVAGNEHVADLESFGEVHNGIWLVGINNIGLTVPESWHEIERYEVNKYQAVHYSTQ